MPGKTQGKKKEADPSVKITSKAIKRIWGQVGPQDWMQLLTVAYQDSRWTISGDKIQGRCPWHDDHDPSFHIDLTRQSAKCFSPNCGKYFWDPVRFYAELQATPLNYVAALTELKDRFNIKLPLKAIRAMGRLHKHRAMKKMLFDIMNGELDDAYGTRKSPPKELSYALPTIRYLEARGIPPAYASCPIGVLPPTNRLKHLHKLHCATNDIDNNWEEIEDYLSAIFEDKSMKWLGALVFFTGASPNDIAKLKVRSVPKIVGSTIPPGKDVKFIQDDLEPHNGVFGLFGTPAYQASYANPKLKSFAFMEGEFDALSIMARQFDTHNVGFFAFSGGGGSVGSLDLLKDFGFLTGRVVPDKDDGGEGFVKAILKDTLHVVSRIFVWPPSLSIQDAQGKPLDTVDPDEAVKEHGLEKFTEEFRKEENFILPYQWALDRARIEMHSINPDDVRYLTNTAAKWGHYVRNSAEQQTYLTDLSKQFRISAGLIMGAMTAGEDNEEAFIERIRNVLEGRLHVMYMHKEGSSHMLRVFDKCTNEIYDFCIAERKRIRSTLESLVRGDIFKFIREEVGEPGFLKTLEDANDEKKPIYLSQEQILTGYVSNAVTNLSASLPKSTEMKPLGAGLHCIKETSEDSLDVKHTLYLVNGMNLFKGEFEEDDRLIWTQQTGPSDGCFVVYTRENSRPKTIYPQFKTSDDLNRTPTMSMKEVFDSVYEIIHTGWDFKNHDVTSELLTAYLMQIFIANCLPRQPQVMFTSEQSGGKSSILGGLLGKTHVPAINLVQPSFYSDNFTPAGIRQSLTYSTVAACLDEFEDKGGNDRKSGQIRGVLYQLRGLANEGGGSVMGSASGVHQEFNLVCPIFLGGIRGLDDAADISRYVIVEMDKKADRQSPESILMRKPGEARIRQIREALPLVMMHNARAVMRTYLKIKERYQDGGGLEYGKITRSREQYYAPMAIMQLSGRDPHRFIKRCFRAYRSNLERIANASLSNDLFTEVLHSPTIKIQEIGGATVERTLNSILSSDQPELVNDTYSGIYYDEDTKWVVVNWATARSIVLANSGERYRAATWLKTSAMRSKNSIPDARVRRSSVLKRLEPVMGHLTDLSTITVFNVENLRKDIIKQQTEGIRGKETIDMREEYKDRLAVVNFPTPLGDSKKKKGGGGKGGGGSSTPPAVDDEDNFDY